MNKVGSESESILIISFIIYLFFTTIIIYCLIFLTSIIPLFFPVVHRSCGLCEYVILNQQLKTY